MQPEDLRIRTFQDIRDVAADTISQVRNRDLTGDQVKGIQGLLSLAADTIVKEEAINRALVANTAPTPGVSSTTTPPPKGATTTGGTFILNLNVPGAASNMATVAPDLAPDAAQIIDVEEEPQILPPRTLSALVSISGEEAAEHLGAARAAAHSANNSQRSALAERLRKMRP